ncbi:MAG: hypothetical protein ACU0BF_07575 [Paracoccaceae bacterium]
MIRRAGLAASLALGLLTGPAGAQVLSLGAEAPAPPPARATAAQIASCAAHWHLAARHDPFAGHAFRASAYRDLAVALSGEGTRALDARIARERVALLGVSEQIATEGGDWGAHLARRTADCLAHGATHPETAALEGG